jgi:hypothetical protein
MKKIFLFVLVACFCCSCNTKVDDYAEENVVYSVGGVDFGESIDDVAYVISCKSSAILESNTHSLMYRNTEIGGHNYDYATFYFTSRRGLVSVKLQDVFKASEESKALRTFESVKSQYESKYTNMQQTKDEEDCQVYACGSYIDGYDYLPITISYMKSTDDGDTKYYVLVEYYSARSKNLFNDEI